MDASPAPASLRVLTQRHLIKLITSFQSGLPLALLQFETLHYALVDKRARLWKKPTSSLNASRIYTEGAANGEWLATALVSNRFDIAEQILRFREQNPTLAGTNPMFVIGDLPRLVAIAGTVEQLQWIQDKGVVSHWSASLLNHLVVQLTRLSKRKIRRRREMEAVMRWIIAFHPECTTPLFNEYIGLTFKRLELLCGIVGQTLLTESRTNVDWSGVTLDDLTRISMTNYRAILSRDASLPVELAQRGDLESLRFLAENNLARWSRSCIHQAASHGHLECVQLICAYFEAGGRRTIEQAARNGHVDVVRFLQTHMPCTQKSLDMAISRGHITVAEHIISLTGFTFSPHAFIPAVRNQQLEAVQWMLDHRSQALESGIVKDTLQYVGHKALIQAARSHNFEIFRRIHDAFHSDCCQEDRPHRINPMEEAARSGNAEMVYWFMEHCEFASQRIDAAVIKAALSVKTDEECCEVITRLLHMRKSSTQELELADLLTRAARRGFQRVVQLLLSEGEPFMLSAMDQAVTSGNLTLVQTLAEQFPDHLALARFENAVELEDESLAMFAFVHEKSHDRECLKKIKKVVRYSNHKIPSAWMKLVHLHRHCKNPVQPSDGVETMLVSLKAAIIATPWLGYAFLLRFPTQHEDAQTQLQSLSRTERLHLTLALQQGFPSLFQPWQHLPWPGRLSRVLASLQRGDTTEHDVIHAHQH